MRGRSRPLLVVSGLVLAGVVLVGFWLLIPWIAGGHGPLGTKAGDAVIAYALPNG